MIVLAHSSMHFNAELNLLTSISVAKTANNFKSSAKFFIVTLYSDNTSASSLMYRPYNEQQWTDATALNSSTTEIKRI